VKTLIRSITFLTAFALAAIPAVPAFAGIHYTATTTTRDAKDNASDMVVEGWVSGEKARVEFKESNNPMAGAGAFLITKDGGRTVYLVNPEEKTYMRWDMAALLGTAGAVMEGMGPMLKFEFTDPQVQKLAQGAGGEVLGYPTTHTKYRTAYSMKIKVFGMGNESDIVSEQEFWTTNRLADAGLGVWLSANPPRTGNEQLDKLIDSEMGKVDGFVLRSETVTTTTGKKKGKTNVTRSSMKVTSLDANASVPDARFEIPAGYEQTEMPNLQGAQTGEGEGQGERKGGLRGLLGGGNDGR
jgi:hypothetical protein